MTAEEIIAALDLKPHPEGGHFRETFRDTEGQARAHSTAIYYLLRQGELSHWHRIDAVEIWHFYAGDPLELEVYQDDVQEQKHILGPDVTANQKPQVIVLAQAWQQARPLGDWTLVGCTVAPGFDFESFELAPQDWSPS